ncbi:MAG: hypothetical protein Q8P62_02085 [Candidatus Peregrinibacteria bacterium]|nr:hypothetical protein [Candidatus Peregrinibacteria bacterium]
MVDKQISPDDKPSQLSPPDILEPSDQTLTHKATIHDKLLSISTTGKEKIAEKFKDKPEKAAEFLAFAKALYPHLPESEQAEFAENPIGFISSTMVFRGLTPAKYEDAIKEGHLNPQGGAMGMGTGVFYTDSPYQAITYQERGTIVVVEKKDLILHTSHGILVQGSEEYKKAVSEVPPGSVSVWDMEDLWDLANRSGWGGKDSVFCLRKPQPLSNTKVCLRWDNNQNKFVEDYPPTLQNNFSPGSVN